MKILSTILFPRTTQTDVAAQAANTPPPKTRAQVAQELQEAKANGQYTFGELDYPPPASTTTQLSAEAVQAQLAEAKASGQYTFGELDYPPNTTAASPGKTRAEVQAELAQAKANGEYKFGELD